MKKSPRPAVRYSEAVANQVLDLMMQGHSVFKIGQMEGMPSDFVIRKWAMDNHNGFGDRYWDIRRAIYDGLLEEILEIADDSSGDAFIDQDGKRKLDNEFVQRSRLRVDTRKWILCKVLPKIYNSPANGTAETDTVVTVEGGLPDA